MPWAAVGSVVGAGVQAFGANKAAKTQAQAAQQAAAQQAAAVRPYTDAGKQAIGSLQTGLAPGGDFTKKFSVDDMANVSPAYQFALSQGLQSVDNTSAAKGNLLGTQGRQADIAFTEGLATQAEGQAFNQYLAQNKAIEDPLLQVAGMGAKASGAVGDTAADAALASGNARAAGQVGVTNAIAGGIEGLTSAGTAGDLGKLFGTKAAAPGAGGYNPQGNTYGLMGTDTSGTDPFGNLGGAATAGDYSDDRLKEDVVKVGQTDAGLPIYRYRLKGGGPVRIGVMAQDVERVNPRAVSQDHRGYKLVDYAQVT